MKLRYVIDRIEKSFVGDSMFNTGYIGLSTGIDWLTSGSDGMFMDSMPVGVVDTSVGGIVMQSASTIADSSDDGGPDFYGRVGGIDFKGWFKDSIPYARVEKKAHNVYETFSKRKIILQKGICVAKNQQVYTLIKKLLINENGMINDVTLAALEKVLIGDE